ncbi:alpha-E domain-containing protein [soil metagenome]
MLARIAYQLYWIGRYVSRAEHTARMLDGVFAASIQARPTAPSRQALSWEAVMAVMGAESGDHPVAAGQAVRTLTLDPDSPASVTACVDRAREGARTVRDVVSTEMWEALNTLYLELDESDLGAALQTGPYSVYAFVRERCALWWGLADQTMLRDPAFAFLSAGRHSEAAGMMMRMLRVTLFAGGTEGASGGERAIALLQAVGGLEAFRRSVAAPAETEPVARFLTFESSYPHSIAASIEALQGDLGEADPGGRQAAPILRLARLRAELEFHRGQRGADVWSDENAPHDEDTASAISDLLKHVQQELEVVDTEVENRYFSGEAPMRQVVYT